MAIGDIGKIQLYMGPIYKVFADDFILDKYGRPCCTKKSAVDKKNANFYVEDSKSADRKNLEHNCVLARRNEALICCDDAFKRSKSAIIKAFKIEDPKEQRRALEAIKADTECLYYDPNELVPSEKITKKELIKRIKIRDEINARSQNKKK